MVENIKFKLDKISDFWSHYILNYRLCKNEIKSKEGKNPTYSFSNLMSYMNDTIGVIEMETNISDFHQSFSYHIGLLQAIYIQQDLIEELLMIFKCGIHKGELKKDPLYYLNRDLRNELVGHPIRKIKKEISNQKVKTVLQSTVLMDIRSNSNTISYARHHIDNNYEFEKLSYEVKDIIKRHYEFLNKYLDIIILKSKNILSNFEDRVLNLRNIFHTKDFNTVVNLVSLHFEHINECHYLFQPDQILKIYSKRKEHFRYQNAIEYYLKTLNNWINETLDNINFTFKERKFKMTKPLKPVKYKVFSSVDSREQKVSFHYELGKLSYKRNFQEFNFFSGLLRDKCLENKLIQEELNHMQKNLSDDIEYYSSYYLVSSHLRE